MRAPSDFNFDWSGPGFSKPLGSRFKSPTARPLNLTDNGTNADPVYRHVADAIADAKLFRKRYDYRWPMYYRYYYGQQWPPEVTTRRLDWRAYLVVNHIFSIIQSIVAVMLDSKPKISVGATSPYQHVYAGTLQAVLDSVWDRRYCYRELVSALTNALIFGTGIIKAYWDHEEENGQGDLCVSSVQTENFFVNRGTTDINTRDNDYCLEKKLVSIPYIRRRFGERGKLVRSDTTSESSFRGGLQYDRFGNFGFDQFQPFNWSSPVTSQGDNTLLIDKTEFSTSPYKSGDQADNLATLWEYWTRDYTEEEYTVIAPQWDPRTNQMVHVEMTQTRPKYPYGRLIHVANGIVLRDVPSPYRMFPYVRVVDIGRPNEFWGLGEVEVLYPLQNDYNRRRSQIADHCSLMGNAIWIIDRSSLVDPDSLTNKPGAIIETNGLALIRREPPVPLPQWMFTSTAQTASEMREIAGVSAVAGGIPPKGVRSGQGMEAAQGIATTRIRSRGRDLEISIEQLGRLMISILQDYVQTPRVIRIVGSTGHAYWVPFDGRSVRGDWDIKVEAGSTLSQTKSSKDQLWIQLFQMGAVDRRALLENIGVSGYEEILRRTGEGVFVPQPGYEGFPGFPNPYRSTDRSGYSLPVREMPTYQVAPPQAGPQAPPGQAHAGAGAPH
jgi:hypothetical protein